MSTPNGQLYAFAVAPPPPPKPEPHEWSEESDQFQAWAQNRARHALGLPAIVDSERTERPFPTYAKQGDCVLIHQGLGRYYRTAGHWAVQAEWDGNILRIEKCVGFVNDAIVGLKLVEATRREWLESNRGYI